MIELCLSQTGLLRISHSYYEALFLVPKVVADVLVFVHSLPGRWATFWDTKESRDGNKEFGSRTTSCRGLVTEGTKQLYQNNQHHFLLQTFTKNFLLPNNSLWNLAFYEDWKNNNAIDCVWSFICIYNGMCCKCGRRLELFMLFGVIVVHVDSWD